MYHDLVLNLGPLLCYAYITFFSKIRNIDNYQSIYVKLKFPLKDIIFYNTSLLWKKKKKEMKISQFSIFFCMWQVHPNIFLRSNHLEMCYFHVYLHVCETQVQSCTGSAIFGIPHLKFYKVLWQAHLFTFSN